ncbi:MULTISPECIES: nuclear transport factor 2 family protein [unclassified Streptomyces]|uniref:nuclear transport factor 2 family protein n=1 Tax=unclassified Streptomyces TaxID=2593676 RepID=UPI00109EBE2F|nr:nuclear transport factor 2 family protein [Streptomyces sp. A1136]THA58715.1 nuclear transport factor 2 family protein [Streptomyces sp. A1136]
MSALDAREILRKYYEYANAGDWDRWCDLFAEDQVMDEQLAGRVEGLETLRSMMKGMGTMYRSFRNEPVHFLVDGEKAAAVSHLTAVSPAGEAIEAEVMNFFRIVDGKIVYMSNHHDTVPFQVLGQG